MLKSIFFMILSVLTFASIVLIGIAIAENSLLGAIAALSWTISLMATGFSIKKSF